MTAPPEGRSRTAPTVADTLGASLAVGFATAVAMWCAWFLTHLPGLNLPPIAVAITLLVTWLAAATLLARCWGIGPRVGALAGITTSLINLLALGSLLVEQPDPTAYAGGQPALHPNAFIAAAGFIAVGAVVGAIAGAIGAAAGGDGRSLRPGESWLGRLALVAAIAVAPLILIGGAVTSTESGLAVTGWPDTFGANMFLYPISLMSEPRIYFEHTHRLFGAMVGLCFLTLTVLTLATPTGRSVRFWVVLAFAIVCVQGVFGGLRVTEGNPYLGMVHGVLGQVVLVLAVCIAAWLTPLYLTGSTEPDPRDRKRKALATGALHATLFQLVLGAAFRHLRREDIPGAMHALMTHIGFSLVVLGLALAAGFLMLGRPGVDRIAVSIRRLGKSLIVVVGLQFALGWLAFWAVLSAPKRGPVPDAERLTEADPVPLFETIASTLHQANGALFIALAALAVVWTRRALKAANKPVASPTE